MRIYIKASLPYTAVSEDHVRLSALTGPEATVLDLRAYSHLAIGVSFACGDAVRLEVCDAGRAVPAQTAAELLRGPVPSDSGLGIGLYQVARHAETFGLVLTLAHNADGKVSFVLSGALKPAAGPAAIPAA